MPLDFSEIIEDGAKAKALADEVIATVKSFQAVPPPSLEKIGEGIAQIIKDAFALAAAVKADIAD